MGVLSAKISAAIPSVLLCASSALGETGTPCGVNSAASTNLPLVPKTGVSKALVVFVQFTDDNFEGGCSTDPNVGWRVTQPHSLPPWWTKAIDPTATGTHTPGSITDYFCKMSRKKNDPDGHGDFHLIGEEYPQLLEPGTSPGALTRQNQATKANEVLRTVRDNAASLGIDLNAYDLYTNGTENRRPDGIFDMIVLIWRTNTAPGHEAYSDVGHEATPSGGGIQSLGNLAFDWGYESGITWTKSSGISVTSAGYNFQDMMGTFAHEYGHRLLTSSGGVLHYDQLDAWRVMSSGGYHGSMCAYERVRLGWITPEIITANTSRTLTDAITTSDVYRINAYPDGHQDVNKEYFLIENRQRIFVHDQGQPGSGCNGYLPGTGLIITHVRTDLSPSLEVLLEEADNGAGGVGSTTDPWYPGNTTVFSPWSAPNSNRRNGSSSDRAVEVTSVVATNLTVDIYITNPQNASPAKPQNLQVRVSQAGSNSHPRLSWAANTEPDKNGYPIWRKLEQISPPQVIQPWQQIRTQHKDSTTFLDTEISLAGSGNRMAYYKIKAIDTQSKVSEFSSVVSIRYQLESKRAVSGSTERSSQPAFRLSQNAPNPFNPQTEIRYELPEDSHVSLKVYNVLGEEVRSLFDEEQGAGSHLVRWDARDQLGQAVPSGVYIYRIMVKSPNGVSQQFTETKKMIVLR